jgi:hypothetical protein
MPYAKQTRSDIHAIWAPAHQMQITHHSLLSQENRESKKTINPEHSRVQS